ncbi:bacteriophage abortive infection AbiH family protein [Plesiomonas shigelloides]|uniref:bacteriophage abortive infection AbiH family protein n=1 Tax=Plesiomonas shigelloides TaxID=703 RepID=UPI0021177517|nr:bacteriophage abortive infection AbiH family protein [Plesiomonas shigelloides]
MSNLFIIGNGFDIWNQLPTSYWHFHQKYQARLDEHIHYFDDFCDIDSEWANFEESLGSFNQDAFHDNVAMQPSLEELGDDPTLLYGFEDEIAIKKDALVDDITNAFNTWIRSVDVNAAQKLIHFNLPAHFINFNYTTTLQDVYNIPEHNVLHIHGKVGREIIFGHGRNIMPPAINEERDEPWFHESTNQVAQVLNIFHKPVNDILDRHRQTLNNYGEIDNIVVIGHSVNDIDAPYFQCILAAYPAANWQNYNYENLDEGIDEVSVTHDKLLTLGVPADKLSSFSSEKLKELYPVS